MYLSRSLRVEISVVRSAVPPLCLKVKCGVEIVSWVSVSLSHASNGDKEEVNPVAVTVIILSVTLTPRDV